MSFEELNNRVESLLIDALNQLMSVLNVFSQAFGSDWGVVLGIGLFLLSFWRYSLVLKLSTICIIVAGLAVPFPFVLDLYLPRWGLPKFGLPSAWLILFTLNASAALVLCIVLFRLGTLFKEWVKSSFVLENPSEREGLTDVRQLKQLFPKTKLNYSSEKRFANKYFFFGLGVKRREVKLPVEQVNKQHIAVTGPTGSGKGVALQSLMAQAISKGQATIYVDPNFDNIALRVLEQYSKRSKRPFIFIDLNGDVPQWNPWSKKSQNEIEELCAAVFGLSDNHDIADVYRLLDRQASIAFAKIAADRHASPVELISDLLEVDPSLPKDAKKFITDLSQLADMPVCNIRRGLDLLDAIQNRAVIYVRGATRNPRVLKLQRLFVLAVIHAAEQRRREELEGPPVFLVIDEYKYSCSPQSTEALATVRKSGVHIAIATQSYQDLRNCPKDMDADSVISSVVENATLHINYKSNDFELSEVISKSTGTIAVDEEVREIALNPAWAETTTGSRSLRKGERSRIDTNMFMNMPQGCAVIRGNIEPQIIHICPVKVDMNKSLPVPTTFPSEMSIKNTKISLSEELIDVD